MIVGDEALTKSFVEAGHRLGDQDGTKPETNITHGIFRRKKDSEETWSPRACRTPSS